ncbi:MFS transporter [Fodinicurvata fenggangensis]|uniref:MFS transporter n=1 Tax=Fodinicurvata fenggangensis TaxID=1121830 RepID=UPI00068E0A47|nr:MFS transporter [Fodinicurvata fenggangensis]
MRLHANLRLAFPYAAFQAAIFFTLGIYLPFWPLWLEEHGLGATEIAVLLAASAWLRILATPAFGLLADRWAYGRFLPHLLAAGALCTFGLFHYLHGFWALLPVQVLAICLFHPLIPLSDSRSMAAVRIHGLDYGRIRLWGSLAFILASSAGGWLIADSASDVILLLIMIGLGFCLLTASLLPYGGTAPRKFEMSGLSSLMANRDFLAFLAAAALLQSSHALYYGFGSIYWRSTGFDETTIGLFWAIGVIAEIAFFAYGAFFLKRFGTKGLLLLAGLAGCIRWSLTPVLPLAETTLLLQCLHAFTYAAAHLGAMHFISAHTPSTLAATAQTLYAALTGGLAMGGMLFLAGPLYDTLQGQAYFIMSLLSLAGVIAVIALPASSDHKEVP